MSKQTLTGTIKDKGRLTGAVSVGIAKVGEDDTTTYILIDENGNKFAAVLTDEKIELTATATNDIRLGLTAVTEDGIVTGEKVIPAYHTTEGIELIPNGKMISITSLSKMDLYEFTKLQALICIFDTNLTNSVSTIQVSIDGKVYDVKTTTPISDIYSNSENRTIDFGIKNETGKPIVLRFFTYKEII